MNIVLHGGEFVNKGAEAMALTVQKEIGDRIPGCTFEVVQTEEPSQAYRSHVDQVGGKIGTLDLDQSRMEQVLLLLQQLVHQPKQARTWLRQRRATHLAPVIAERADAIIDISGFAYADKRGIGYTALMSALVYHMKRRGKPYIFMPQCWGPFRKDPELRALCAGALPEAQRFYARDKRSRGLLADLLGRSKEDVPLSADIAFLFEPSEREDAREQMQTQGLAREGRPLVGVAPNMRVYERTDGEGTSNTYLQDIIRLCLISMDECGADVALVPHEIKHGSEVSNDDRMLCHLIEESVRAKSDKGPATIIALNHEPEARKVKAFIGVCDLLVGSRFHSLVAALSQGVPPVAVGWAHKYPQLLDDFGIKQFSVRYQDLSPNKLTRLFRKAWGERDTTREAIEKRLPAVQASARVALDETANILRGTLM